MFTTFLIAICLVLFIQECIGKGYIRPAEPIESLILSPLPHQYLSAKTLPQGWDWRNVNGTNYCSKVLTQQNPHVCGSCWAEAATGALTDRYNIATNNRLRIQLSPQNLLNFKERITGGSCVGGSSIGAYKFINKYGITDDTCTPFSGINWEHGFTVADMYKVDDVKNHQCFLCNWNGDCTFVKRDNYELYGADEYGEVSGIDNIKAEIYARGPISCPVNSEADSFDLYHGGIITCDNPHDKECANKEVDHVIVIAGWGYDEATQTEYWIGRNSYGTQWGEGAGGGWFRMKLGTDVLGLESNGCTWATPSKSDVDRAVKQFKSSL